MSQNERFKCAPEVQTVIPIAGRAGLSLVSVENFLNSNALKLRRECLLQLRVREMFDIGNKYCTIIGDIT